MRWDGGGSSRFVLTSMVKRVDNAVYQIVSDVKNGKFNAGLHVFGLESDGVGYVVDEHNRDLLHALVAPRVEIGSGRGVEP